MSLHALLTSIAARLPDGVSHALGGAEEVARGGSPPRVIFDFVSEAIESPHGQGSGLPRSRWLCTRASDVDLHIWGASLEATEELAELVLNLLQEMAPGDSHRRRGARWVAGALSLRGYVYVLGVTFLLPVERRQVYLTLAELPLTGEFESA